ncbi:Response regulator [Sulfidibacter corallicola]|uniref:histidine kinase n=1 Tax=Sulfidibacter corallicola TaxID=2818388 RepID=A0A8A4TI77_SULCO|nr:two-component regulator propeller domain-containing protein [Sulfidibacter corallicola]QTD48894.1 response regulator [Sulfidibacter corallicola]
MIIYASLSFSTSARALGRHCLFALLSLALPLARAQPDLYHFERITPSDGLPHSVVNDIAQDDVGFLWFGTQEGLSRYDGFEFRVFKHDSSDATSLSDNYVRCVLVDRQGRLWVGTSNGLNRLERNTQSFVRYLPDRDRKGALSSPAVRQLFQDRDDRLWVSTLGGGLNRLDPETGTFEVFRHDPNDPTSLSHDQVETVYQTRDGTMWAGCVNGINRLRGGRFTLFANGSEQPDFVAMNQIKRFLEDDRGRLWVGSFSGTLQMLDRDTGQLTHYPLPDGKGTNVISDLLLTDTGSLWLATYSGLFLFDPDRGYLRQLTHDPADPISLSGNLLRSLFRDQSGLFWVGTFEAGVNKVNLEQRSFIHYRYAPNSKNGLGDSSIRGFHPDGRGHMWIATGKGVERLDLETGTFEHFRHDPNDPGSLSSDDILEVFVDAQGTLWVGAFGGGLLSYDEARGAFRHYRHLPGNPRTPSGDYISSINQTEPGALWIGTFGDGLDHFDRSSGIFTRFTHDPGDHRSLAANRIWRILPRDHRLLLGTYGGGLSIMDPTTNTFTNYDHDPNDPTSLSHDNVYSIYHDSGGRLWVGTSSGLDRAVGDLDALSFHPGPLLAGGAGNSIYGILEDDAGLLWISTNAGISRLDPETHVVRNFDESHGLQSLEFKEGAWGKSPDGDLWFGGSNGFNRFRPEKVFPERPPPPVVITEMERINRQWMGEIAGDRRDAIVLDHRDAVISFSFAALDYAAPKKNRYAFKLEGFDEAWVYSGNRHRASYTNLDAGTYRFRVKAANNDGVWNETGIGVPLRVLPPPWRTWWAYGLYLLAGIALLAVLYRAKTREQRLTLVSQQAQLQAMEKLDRLKDEFLANTSHELRTPLNGIVGLAESLLEGARGSLEIPVCHDLDMIASSGRRLAGLVDDILDFSKLRQGALKLRLRPVHLATIVETVFGLCQPLVAGKPVTLAHRMDASLPDVLADENRLFQIMHNLVGNAIKFTEQGAVTVTAEPLDGRLRISVSDTGIGIAPEAQERVFETFEQADGSVSRTHGGTGLGLAIVRQLVTLHGSRITLDSTPGEGSTFRFELAIANQAALREVPVDDAWPEVRTTVGTASELTRFQAAPQPEGTWEPQMELAVDGDGVHILVVDDEPVNIQVLINHLAPCSFSVDKALDGAEAIRLLDGEKRFDLVLLDIMMPRMSGYEVCTEIRRRYSADELPIVLLTAKNLVADLVRGFESGANDYILKPVSKGELLARIEIHIELANVHRKLKTYSRRLEAEVAERTRALEGRNNELEQLNEIIKSVNQKVKMDELLETIVERATDLFPKADIAMFLQVDRKMEYLQFRHVRGEHAEAWVGRRLPYRMLREYFESGNTRLERGIYLLDVEAAGRIGDLPWTEAILAMTLALREEPEGFLVLGSHARGDAFLDSDVERCRRFREHALTAFAKARMFAELEEMTKTLFETQQELVRAAHGAGMAEIATEVLHNVGNELNSINVSIESISSILEEDPLRVVDRVFALIRTNNDRLAAYLAEDPQGRKITSLVPELIDNLRDIHESLRDDAKSLRAHVKNIRLFMRNQNELAEAEHFLEQADLNNMLHAALTFREKELKRHGIVVNRELTDLPGLPVNKPRLQKVLDILIENAREAMAGLPSTARRELRVATELRDDRILVAIGDSGTGIEPGLQARIFAQGFSTKGPRRGGSLHYAANTLKQLGGHIRLREQDRGTTLVLELPLRFETRALDEPTSPETADSIGPSERSP